MSIQKLIKSLDPITFQATLRIFIGEDKFLGPGKVELLEFIQETGSISQAAKKMGMSYKKAWDMIQALNAQCNQPIVSTKTGGAKGGKALVSPAGEHLIQAFKLVELDFQQFLSNQSKRFSEM